MKNAFSFVPLIAILLFGAGHGCATRPIAPDGVYGGDALLYAYEKAVVAFVQERDAALAFADRNDAFVAGNERLARLFSQLRERSDRWIVEAAVARDAYLAVKTPQAAQNMADRIAFLQAMLGEVRGWIATAGTEPSTR